MAMQPFALTLYVQPDKSQWIDWKMDVILEREEEMSRLGAQGDWQEALYSGAASYPLVLTAAGVEGLEALTLGVSTEVRIVREGPDGGVRVGAYVVKLDGQELTRRPVLVEAGIAWVEPRRQEATKTLHPPAENVVKGWTCEGCKRFSYEDGQRWLNEITHPFAGEGQSRQMWRDVISMIGENVDVQLPSNPLEWGACLEHHRLIERTFPGCDKHVARVVWGKPNE